MQEALSALGIDPARIHTELFGALSQPGGLAVSPAIGPVPAISVPRSSGPTSIPALVKLAVAG